MDLRFNMYPLVPTRVVHSNGHEILGTPTMQYEMAVHNFTHTKITVTHRNGFSYAALPATPANPEHRGHVVVQHKFTTSRDVIKYMACKLNAPPEALSEAQKVLMGVYDEREKGIPRANYYGSYLCLFPARLFEEFKEYYVADADICLSTNPVENTGPHPFSKDAEIILRERGSSTGDIISVVAIDNSGSRRAVYMPYDGRVVEIHTRMDVSREDGIYIHHRQPILDRHGNSLPSHYFLKFEDCNSKQPYQFFLTKPAAFEYLRQDEHNELLLARLKHDTEKLKADSDKAKAELAVAEAEIKRKESAIKARETELRVKESELKASIQAAEHAEQKLRDLQKQRFESRMSFRKELVETVKLVAPIVGLVQLYLKLKTSGS